MLSNSNIAEVFLIGADLTLAEDALESKEVPFFFEREADQSYQTQRYKYRRGLQ
jgi:hypothetical protein